MKWDQSDTQAQEEKDRLIRCLKRDVKHLMEESVAKKTVHEESSNVSGVCSTVDTCLQLGLKRRSLGLFKTNSSSALLQKISKDCIEATDILKRIDELEKTEVRTGANGSNGLDIGKSFPSLRSLHKVDSSSNLVSSSSNRFFWIRISLFEKKLHKIISHLVQNSERFYEPSKSIVADPELGQIFSSLMVGPCALEFTRMKPENQYWSDPPAGELVQRHRISSVPKLSSLPTLTKNAVKKTLSSQMTEGEERRGSIPFQAREYVESLHQNNTSALLYGKNNVEVVQSGWPEPLPGYLSLHQTGDYITLKWTPNSLMDRGNCSSSNNSSNTNGSNVNSSNINFNSGSSNSCKGQNSRRGSSSGGGNMMATWQQAVTVNMQSILYLHCHQDLDKTGTLVMVGVDGIQYPPMNFPPGDNLITFLGCLETALLPNGVLNPPLWSTKSLGSPTRKSSLSFRRRSREKKETLEEGKELATEVKPKGKDAVFKLIYIDDALPKIHESLQKTRSVDWFSNIFHMNRNKSSLSFAASSEHQGSCDLLQPPLLVSQISYDGRPRPLSMTNSPTTPIKGLCSTMRKQIISRAFYGWLAHCRNTRTIRNHLQGLVIHNLPPMDQKMYQEGLTEEVWKEHRATGLDSEGIQTDIYRRIYYGGVQHSLRREVWQYLLGHLDWSDTVEEIQRKESRLQSEYESKISEWGALEAIVIQQDREITAANIARLSLGKSTDSDGQGASSSNNDVFSSVEHEAEIHSQSTEYSPTHERPSTITEVTEHSGTSHSRDKKTSASSCDEESGRRRRISSCEEEGGRRRRDSSCDEEEGRRRRDSSCEEQTSSAAIMTSMGRNGPGAKWRTLVSASDEGIEDLNEECDSLSSHPGGVQLAAMYKVTTPSIDSGNPDSSPPDRNPHFLDDRMLARRHSDQASPTFPGIPTPRLQTLSVGSELLPGVSSQDLLLPEDLLMPCEDLLMPGPPPSTCPSPASSEGGTYTMELLDSFGLNLHRIDKDVARCDRNHPYFTQQHNLDKLRNIVTTYVWENLDVGYMQGMCDLVAPLLVVMDDEVVVYNCFLFLMTRMIDNFPTGTQMDNNFANMRALMQVLDQNLYDTIQNNGDFSHFYFCYRWFLLDFKREFSYDDVYLVWETIWAAGQVVSPQFYLFIALGLVETYRDIILDRNMDFTDIIKFFNEMAERHEAKAVLTSSRDLLDQLADLIADN